MRRTREVDGSTRLGLVLTQTDCLNSDSELTLNCIILLHHWQFNVRS